MTWTPVINCSVDASGARQAALANHLVVIVDIIDMSTTLEGALEAGALKVYGASPDRVQPPVPVNPFRIGQKAGLLARQLKVPVVIVAEPRFGPHRSRLAACASVRRGLHEAGVADYLVVPNLGASTAEVVDFKSTIVVAVTYSGGVAYDAAYNAGGTCTTATIARTRHMKGLEPARRGIQRALHLARIRRKNITFVAASSQSLEDVLAAQWLSQFAVANRNRRL
ncbi:MAG TPA: hypothetical protein GXX34_03285 [Clostridia bacterium]|nr:hypothetical protein [Clostridia bacterium]